MKLIIAGATGFVGIETTLQALAHTSITSVVALTRRSLELPKDEAKTSKLTTIVLDDFSHYPDSAKEQLADADACIWTISITPRKAKGVDFATVRRTCYDHTFTGLDVLLETRQAKASTPFRFLYISGIAVSCGGPSEMPDWVPAEMRPYVIIRSEVENTLVARTKTAPESPDLGQTIDLCVVRPGYITEPGKSPPPPPPGVPLPSVGVEELAAAMLDQVVNGFEKDPLLNEDLVRIGRNALEK